MASLPQLQGFLTPALASSLQGYADLALLSQYGHLFANGAGVQPLHSGAAQEPQKGSPVVAATSNPKHQVVQPVAQHQAVPQPAAPAEGGGKRRSRAGASRHLAAEQRRRLRINDRLEKLRAIVPHAERDTTSTILDNAYSYIEMLKGRVKELELTFNSIPQDHTAQLDAISLQASGPRAATNATRSPDRLDRPSTTATTVNPAFDRSSSFSLAAPGAGSAFQPFVRDPAKSSSQPSTPVSLSAEVPVTAASPTHSEDRSGDSTAARSLKRAQMQR